MLNVTYPQTTDEYRLAKALFFYQGNSRTIATLHGVRGRELLAGKSLDVQDLEELFHSCDQRSKMTFFPPEVVAWSRNEVLWFEKSRIRPIYFNAPEPKRRFVNKISGQNVLWPNLLMQISRHEINCWAVKSSRKPSPHTKLYRAPFINISNNHRFCPPNEFHGLSDENIIDFARKAADLFFRGHFSHLYGNMEPRISRPGGLDRFWVHMAKQLAAGKVKSFPNQYLVPANLTVRNVVA